jgi:tetratricopeptide (TPR) repeat protein
LRPKSAETWNSKGATLKDVGRLNEALIAFDQAIALNPKYIEAWNNKGAALIPQGQFEQAIVCIDQALALDSAYDQAWINKGAILHNQGKQEEAIACFERAIKINPSAQAWSNKGMALRRLGRFEEALKCQDEALQLEPRNAKTWVAKGAALTDAGRYEEAFACFERALQINPKYVLAWMNKGGVLKLLGRFVESVVCFQTVLQLEPNHPVARQELNNYPLLDWVERGEAKSPSMGPVAQSSREEFYQYQKEAIPQHGGLCSDRNCPCPETPIPRGSGYLYISPEAVEFMKLRKKGQADNFVYGPMPVLSCEQGAKLRDLDLEVAAADAKRWWETGKVPLRPTPLARGK